MTTALAAPPAAGRPLRRAALWLAGLAPFFYLTYGTANWLASLRADVPAVVFAWERSIPFLPWTIVPYWSINAFYGLSLFLCRTRAELDAHAARLLAAQVVAVAVFLATPLRFTFEKPDAGGGLAGFLFAALGAFDKPFNQAPSLHIALLVILWDLYRRLAPRWSHPVLDGWAVLIGVSVLTTWQHHFIDVPTGALLGLLCVWAIPLDGPSPLARPDPARERARWRMAGAYAFAALVFSGVAAGIGGAALWLFWPAAALALVAAAYGLIGPAAFGKRPDGSMPLASRLILLPYLAGALLNSRLWTLRAPEPVTVADGLRLGRLPGRGDPAPPGETLVDVSAELPAPPGRRTVAVPMLDLVPPPPAALAAAADSVEAARRTGPVLVACALGYSRSAAVAATWLLRTGRARTVSHALDQVRAARPQVVVGRDLARAVEEAARW